MPSNTLKITRIGNSYGVILPKETRDALQVGEGDVLYAVHTPDGISLSPYDPEFEDAMSAYQRTQRKYRNALRELAK